MPTVTDSFTFAIQVIQHGIATIQLPITYPTSVEKNTAFNITYTIKNTGPVDDSLYGHLLVGTTEVTGSYWTQTVVAGASVTKTFAHPGISANTTFILEVGHE